MMMLMIVRIDALGLAQHVDAVHLGHPDVGDQHVDALALEQLSTATLPSEASSTS